METQSIPVGSYYANGLDYRIEPSAKDLSYQRTIYYETSARAAATVDMKLSEATNGPKADAPQHSSVDEMDFAGVVDGPTKNVKEIRAMFKAQDHANYAKPKLVMKKSAPPIVAPKPKMRPEKISAGGSNRNSAEVAQQVMGLFKGALELEQQVQQQPPSKPETQEERTEHSEPEIPFKEKIASFSEGKSPKQEQEINNNRNSTQRDSQSEEKRDAPYAEIIKNPSPVAVSNGHERKSSVKQEKVLAESYDESLDQFYDVFDQLTTR